MLVCREDETNTQPLLPPPLFTCTVVCGTGKGGKGPCARHIRLREKIRILPLNLDGRSTDGRASQDGQGFAFARERKVMVIVYKGGKERRDEFGGKKSEWE